MTTYKLTKTFQLNGDAYRTDADTLNVLNSVMPAAKAGESGSLKAVQVILFMGLQAGRIVRF